MEVVRRIARKNSNFVTRKEFGHTDDADIDAVMLSLIVGLDHQIVNYMQIGGSFYCFLLPWLNGDRSSFCGGFHLEVEVGYQAAEDADVNGKVYEAHVYYNL